MKGLLDPSAPIIPGQGLGGLEVGRNVVDYAEVLLAADENHEWWADDDGALRDSWKSIFSLWEARFRLPQVYESTDTEYLKMTTKMWFRARRWRKGKPVGDIWVPETPARGPEVVEIAVDLRDGTVFALRALEGYEGLLFGALKVGMSGREALEADGRLHYSDSEGCLMVDGLSGVHLALEPDGYDLEPSEVTEAKVGEISVFDQERAESGILPMWPPEIP